MNLLRLFSKPGLSDEQKQRLDAWRSLPDDKSDARIVVLDVETTGLDLVRDRLISIGAVAVVNGCIVLSEGFSVVLKQGEVSSRENILIHGISGDEQRRGLPPADALLDFLEYLGKSPLVAFHVAFDETMIRRTMKKYLGFSFRHRWLDLAYALPALWPDLKLRTLDEWATHFSIGNDERHNAASDALATAQLFLVARKMQGYDRLRSVERRYRSSLENP